MALAVDTAMVGRVPDGDVALTGMGYATQLVFLLMVAMIGLTIGTVAFLARAHGAGHVERVQHILHQSSQLTILLGLFVALAGNLFAGPLIDLLGADAPSAEAGLAYLRPLLLGTAFNYLNILYAAALRGVGNTRLAFAVALFMNLLNVVLNYGLILGNYGLPALGLTGAAIGTVVSQALAAGLMFLLLRRGAVPGVTLSARPAAIDWGLARDLNRIGWPAAADMVVLNAAFIAIIGMIARIDQAAVAAHGVGIRIQALAFVPGMSISQATSAMVGNALGAGSVTAAKAVVRSSLVLCTLVMSGLALAIVGLAEPIVGLFGIERGSAVFDYSVQWLRILGYGMPVVGVYVAFIGMLRGAGETMVGLRINTWVTLALQIPASYVLGFSLGLSAWGVWAAFPATFIVKAGWAWRVYRSGRWAKVGAST